jgi:hypothetical protein
LTVDVAGQVFLSGVVASEEDRRIIEEEARNTPGVTRVFSELRVEAGHSDTPPPPPQPVIRVEPEAKPVQPGPEQRTVQQRLEGAPASIAQPANRPRNTAATPIAMARDNQPLTRRVAEALSKRSTLSGLPILLQTKGSIVTLAGRVPSAYEAMLAYRTVEQTPGVNQIVDQLEFQVPDENHPNPLKQKGRPEDVEPYLASQIRRHLGDLAHIDVVRMRGDIVEIRGFLLHAEDQNRVLAIIRSIPLLRDFRLEPAFQTD